MHTTNSPGVSTNHTAALDHLALGRRRFMQLSAMLAGAAAIPAYGTMMPRHIPADVPGSPNGQQGAGYYRFQIGSIEAVALHDGSSKLTPIQPAIASEATADELNSVLREYHHSTDAANIEFNTLVLKIGAETVLIDTGNGGDGAGVAANLAAAGIKPESITAVIISHAHPDHIFGLVNANDSLAFPNAKVFMSKIEHDFWTADTIKLGDTAIPDEWRKAWISRVPAVIKAVKPKLNLVAGGDALMDALEPIHTPGHTPGHLSVAIRSGKDQLMAMGDLSHNSVVMFAKPTWTIGFDVSKKDAIATRLKMFDRMAADRMRVFGYHMPWPGLGHIRRVGVDSYQWLLESWAW
ncbi:MAG: MBL fold metallo-hydrolase [Planctomycetota bacterium]|nr:MBL fold metallo-hydrolase [Planctomycetota bacterium]